MPGGEELRRLIQRAEADGHEIRQHGNGFASSNGRHGLSAEWSAADGRLKLESLDPRTIWHFSMKTSAPLDAARHDGNGIRFKRGDLEEWFVNDARGLEHGFDVATPPARSGDEGFRVTMELETSLQPQLADGGRSLRFNDREGNAALHYRGLVVFDATNRSLPASMSIAPDEGETWQLAIHVDDRDARYPLVIDPVFTTRLHSLYSSDFVDGERFGNAVSMSGHVLAVGIPGSDGPFPGETGIGSVMMFRYDPKFRLWSQFKRLYPVGGTAEAAFGTSLDLDGDTLIVGAPGDGTVAPGAGAAYLLHRDQGGTDQWGQVAKLLPADGMEEAEFGRAVAVDGDLAVIGAPRHAAAAFNGGAIYIASRNPAGTWSVPAPVGGYAPQAEDQYGRAVAISGQRVAAGAYLGQSAATPADAGIVAVHDFEVGPDGAPLSHVTVLVNDPNPSAQAFFGIALALEGDDLIVGSSNQATAAGAGAGTVEIFRRSGAGTWQWQQELHAPDASPHDRFGSALGLSGDTLAAGAPMWNASVAEPDSGCLHLFERGSGPVAWTHAEQRIPTPKEASAYYGSAISISGDAIAAGAPFDEVGGMTDSGHVETLVRNSAAWVVLSALDGSSEGGLRRGESVAVDRGAGAIGIPGWHTGAVGHGAVAVLSANLWNEDSWGVDELLSGPEEQDGERFGHAVALCGNWLLVGAPGYDKGGLADAGRAYLFRRTDALGWSYYKTLDLPVLTAGAEFGTAVALTERWAFVGAPGMSHGFIFDRYEGGTDIWDIATILDESAAGGRFGAAVTVDGNHAAFAAPARAGVSPPAKNLVLAGAGQVRVYQAASLAGETVWQAVKTLPQPALDGSFGTAGGGFGSSLSMRGGLLLAGEPGHDDQAGRVKVFGLNQGGSGNWGEVRTLTAPDPAPGDRFGHAVALGDRWFFTGAPGRKGIGEVFTWDRGDLSVPSPQPVSRLLHPRGMAGDEFGSALAFSNNELIAGAPGSASSTGLDDAGRYVVFHRQSAGWDALGGAQGSHANSGDRLGTAVAIGDEFMVVGAPSDTVDGTLSAGSVSLYQRNHALSTGWSYVKMLFAADVETGANFGAAVAIDGDSIAIGAPGWDGRGAVYVFRRNQGGANAWGQQKRVDLPAVAAGDDFGAAVALEDDLLAVGSPGNNAPAGVDAGIVHVFGRHQGGTSNWGLLDDFRETAPAAFDFFGSSVDLSGGRVMVGAPLADNSGNASGVAYVYGRINGTGEWVLLDTLLSDGPNNRLGSSVSIDGPLAAAGAPGNGFHAPDSGAAWIYRDLGGDAVHWLSQTRITVGDTENPAIHNGLQFGCAVSIRGDQLVAGARGYDEGALVNVGAAYVFECNQSHRHAWGQVKRLVALSGGTSARMGSSVDMTPEFVVAGAPEAEQGAQVDAGYFFLFGDIGSSYESWARENFGDAAVDNAGQQASVWGPEADPDRDRVPNAVEAYMDLDPGVADSAAGGTALIRDDNGDLVFRYRMGKETHGTEGRVKWSRDLAAWHGGEENDTSDIEIRTRVLSDEADHFIMEARVRAADLAGEGKLFLRLEVNAP